MKTAEEYKRISIKYWIDFDSGSIDTGEYENRIESLFKQAQKDAYNQALDDAAEKAEVAEIEIIPPKPYDQRPYTKYIVNKDSILKLKK